MTYHLKLHHNITITIVTMIVQQMAKGGNKICQKQEKYTNDKKTYPFLFFVKIFGCYQRACQKLNKK